MIWTNSFIAISIRKLLLLSVSGFSIFSLVTTAAIAQPFVYVTLSQHTVSVIDDASFSIVPPDFLVGDNPQGIAITPNGDFAYVANSTSNNVSVIDITNNNALFATVNVGTEPRFIAITPNGDFAYVTNQASNDVSVIDIINNNLFATIDVGDYPLGIAITPNGDFAYVANDLSNNVSVIKISDNTVLTTIPVGMQPRGLAITPDGAFCYVANSFSSDLSVIDIASLTNVATISGIGVFPWGVAITPDGNFAYVTNADNPGSVSVIDINNNNNVSTTISIGSVPRAVAITPDGQHVYVGSANGAIVSVIATATNTVEADVVVNGSPNGIAITPEYGQTLFFTDNGTDKVYNSNLDGTNLQTLVNLNSVNPIGITVDNANQMIYFVKEGEIQRVPVTGGTPVTILDSNDGIGFPIDLVISGTKLYFTDNINDMVWEYDLIGTNLSPFVNLGGVNPIGITVDNANQMIYFVKEGEIQRVPIIGGTPVTILDSNDGIGFPIDLVISGTKLYFTDNINDIVWEYDLIGTNLSTLVNLGGVNPIGIAVDGTNQKVYFVKEGEIQRVPMTGGTPVTILDSNHGIVFPLHLAILGEYSIGVEDNPQDIPTLFKLSQNYPNPFNPVTTISYQLLKSEFVNLSIYNVVGQLVETLVNEHKNAAYYSVEWDASHVGSGVYFYRIEAGEYTETKKCLILK